MIKNNRPEGIGSILKGIIGSLERGRSGKGEPQDIIEEVVPAQILKHIKIKNRFKGRLIINTEDHNWLYEISKYKQRILGALQETEAGIKTKEIFFRVGRIK